MKFSIIELYGLVFTILFNIGPLFQLVKIIRNKSSYNMSLLMWVCSAIGQLCVLMYYVHNDVSGLFNYINCILGFVLNIVMIVSIIYYSKKK
jgi:uncharacterized protein with PQ loop repeat